MIKYRMNRATYWLCCAIFAAFMIIAIYLGKRPGGLELAAVLVAVPRLHDIGRSGWIVAGALGVECAVLFGMVLLRESIDAIMIASGVLALALTGLGVWLGAIPGQEGPNKWGNPPGPGIGLAKGTAQTPDKSSEN